ncbi:MAG: sulfurtransferase [Burkholderiaceae bacterium]
MTAVLNVSCYKFVALPDAQALRPVLLARAQDLSLKGTVLLAEEGINFFLAGTAHAVRGFVDGLRADPRFADLDAKESWSEHVPFKRMLVKVKREIIRMDHPTIQPAAGRAPAVAPATLRRWLDQGHDDEGRPVVTLDTRNAFEVDCGSFAGAVDLRIHKFSEFPRALRAHKADLMDKTVVSFCTGGIRCEKAAILMREEGLSHVYQLDGGILRYFEQTDGAHYQGGCFVFDERQVLTPALKPAPEVGNGSPSSAV